MTNLMVRLHQQHKNIARLLVLLDESLTPLARGENADFRLIEDIVHYLVTYPDLCHHRWEDLIFVRLIERDPASAGAVQALETEHESLRQIGHDLSQLVRGIVGGGITPVDRLLSTANRYSALNREHLQREESTVFPRLAEVLSDADWEALATAAEAQDPLFGEVVDHTYQDLYRAIERAK